jgi:hypothetical protein
MEKSKPEATCLAPPVGFSRSREAQALPLSWRTLSLRFTKENPPSPQPRHARRPRRSETQFHYRSGREHREAIWPPLLAGSSRKLIPLPTAATWFVAVLKYSGICAEACGSSESLPIWWKRTLDSLSFKSFLAPGPVHSAEWPPILRPL